MTQKVSFSGKNLYWVRVALEWAQEELHNQIATCPNVYEFAEDLERLAEDKASLQKLADHIDRRFPSLCEEHQ